jgi:protein O-mannosyl-transferase
MSNPQSPRSFAETALQETSRPGRKLDFWILSGLIVITLIAYSLLFNAQFTGRDDPSTIWHNPEIVGPAKGVITFWTNLKNPTGDIYIPLTQTFWYALARIARLPKPTAAGALVSPLPFHVANIVLHALNGCIVFLIVKRLLRNSWVSAAGAALYLLHPIQVEAVGWASGTKDLLGGFFTLAALYAFTNFALQRASRPNTPAVAATYQPAEVLLWWESGPRGHQDYDPEGRAR